MDEYLRWHDCGKPFCRTESQGGKVSFPDHADWSERLFRAAGGSGMSAKLIGLDMMFHVTKPACMMEAVTGMEKTVVATLMLSAWAAVHANAEMFGGRASEGFKIKTSQLLARCKKVLPWINLKT